MKHQLMSFYMLIRICDPSNNIMTKKFCENSQEIFLLKVPSQIIGS